MKLAEASRPAYSQIVNVSLGGGEGGGMSKKVWKMTLAVWKYYFSEWVSKNAWHLMRHDSLESSVFIFRHGVMTGSKEWQNISKILLCECENRCHLSLSDRMWLFFPCLLVFYRQFEWLEVRKHHDLQPSRFPLHG